MLYKVSLFLVVGLLVGCQSAQENSRDMKPVESGKVVMVKTWPKEQDPSIVSVKKNDLNTVSVRERSPWAGYDRAFGKDLENPPKIGTEFMFPESEYR